MHAPLEPAPPVAVEQFFGCDLRVGTVLACEANARASKPAYKLTLDFGPLGHKTSSAQITGCYQPAQLIGRQVIAVVNFPPRQVASVMSQCLVLAVDGDEGLVLLGTERPVANGMRVY